MSPAVPPEIRGTTAGGLPPEFIMEVGKTVGMQYGTVLVSRNLRPSSAMAFYAMCAGITAAGGDVRDAGTIAIPTLPFASKGAECCVMIGAGDRVDISSILLCNTDGSLFNDSQMKSIHSSIGAEKELPTYSHVGRIRRVSGSLDNYRSRVMEYVGNVDCQVIMDCASDCTCFVAPHVMADLGADLTSVNCHPDGRSPGRLPAPDEANLKELSKAVKSNPGSIGIAFNSNGSRVAVFDESGRYLSGGETLAVLMAHLEPKKVAMPVDASLAVMDALQSAEIIWTERGRGALGEAARAKGAHMAGNMDGYYVFPKVSNATDGITAAALITKIAGENNLGHIVQGLSKSFRSEFSLEYHGELADIVQSIDEKVSSMEYDGLSKEEGWRADMESGWFLITISERDKVIRIVAEGRDKMYGASLMGIATNIVKSSIRKLSV